MDAGGWLYISDRAKEIVRAFPRGSVYCSLTRPVP